MHHRRTIAAVVLAILVIIGIGVAIVTWTSNPAPTPSVSLVADVTPRGWVPVDFGNAQLSVPASWNILYDPSCQPPVSPGTIVVGTELAAACQRLPGPRKSPPVVYLAPLTTPLGLSDFGETDINGFSVWEQTGGGSAKSTNVTVLVPSLGVEVDAFGPGIVTGIIDTLTYSPAAEVLAKGPVDPVPSRWKWVVADELVELKVAVPANWAHQTSSVEGPPCHGERVLILRDSYVVDGDGTQPPAGLCVGYEVPRQPQRPSDGVVIDLHPNPTSGWPPNQLPTGTCTSRNGLTVCPYARPLTSGQDQNAETDILFANVTVQGTGQRYMVEIGLAGNGMVARTILYSLRAA